MDVLPPAWVDIGATGLLAVTVLLVLTGRLIPKSTHDREVAMRDETIATQRQQLNDAIENNDRLTTAVQNLVVPARTSATALNSIANEAQRATNAEGGDE